MKKKELKKLTLNRETLAGLDRSGLWQAQGGVTGYCADTRKPYVCPYTGLNTCDSCQLPCTTNYC